MPLQRRIPKFGFTNIFKKEFQIVNLKDLAKVLDAEETTSETLCKERKIKKKKVPVKILGEGEIQSKLVVKANAFSKSAREKIENAGGVAEVVK